MNPLPRLCDFFTGKTNLLGEDANKTPGTRIVTSIIESRIIDGGGVKYSIQGKLVSSSGQKIFQVGEAVNVLFKNNDPVVILGHTWRKAQFEEAPEVVVSRGFEIATIAVPTINGGKTGVFIASPIDEIVTISKDDIEPDDPFPDILGVSWGQNANILLLKIRKSAGFLPGEVSEDREFFQVFRIKREKTSTKIPKKIDDQGDLIRENGDVPTFAVLDVVKILETKVLPNLKIGEMASEENLIVKRKLVGAERLRLPTQLALDGDFGGAAMFTVPGAQFSDCVSDFTLGEDELAPIVFGDSIDVNLDVRQALKNGKEPYQILVVHAFVDSSDQLQVLYRFDWNPANMFDRTIQFAEVKLLGATFTGGLPVTTGNVREPEGADGGEPFTSNPEPFINEDLSFAVGGVTSFTSPTPISMCFGSSAFISQKFFDPVPGATGLESATNVTSVDFWKVIVEPSDTDNPFGNDSLNDLAVVNLTQGTVIQKTWLDSARIIYDRELFLITRFFADLQIFLGPANIGSKNFAFVNELLNILAIFQGPTLPCVYLNNKAFVDSSNVNATAGKDRIFNTRTEGRDFSGLINEDPFDEENSVEQFFGGRQIVIAVPCTSGTGPNGEILFDIDQTEQTRKSNDHVYVANTNAESAFVPLVRGGNLVFLAIRKEENLIGDFIEKYKIVVWNFVSDSVTLPFIEIDAAAVGKEKLTLKLRAHNGAILVDDIEDGESVLFKDLVRIVGSKPNELDFVPPILYTNNEDGDRRVYSAALNDEGELIFTKTQEPGKDLLTEGSPATLSVGSFTPSFHFTR